MDFFTSTSRNVSVAKYGVSLVTIRLFGFCLDSLNSANLLKVIEGKVNYYFSFSTLGDMRPSFVEERYGQLQRR